MDSFSDICLGVYFSEDYSESDFIISNTGMMYLFQEVGYSKPEGKEREENLSYATMCRVNLETALSNLPLHLPANSGMIRALILGVSLPIYPSTHFLILGELTMHPGLSLYRNFKALALLDLDVKGI